MRASERGGVALFVGCGRVIAPTSRLGGSFSDGAGVEGKRNS